jgi:CheY-like chemotaxis protein
VKRILVVDDEPAVRALVVASLESGDWAVETVADGAGVFEALSVQRPDLILLDVGLPRLSGCEVLRRLRADETTASIPVVLMTGLEPPEDARPDGVLHKPFTPSLLIESISSFLS